MYMSIIILCTDLGAIAVSRIIDKSYITQHKSEAIMVHHVPYQML